VSVEQDIPGKFPEGMEKANVIGDNSPHFTPWFKDFAELTSASYSPIEYLKLALVQEIRKHPELKKRIEDAARKLGKEIDLSKRF